MILFKKAENLQQFISKNKLPNQKIGFVPTMGALHAGHLSLIETAKKDSEIVISSIFVNPTQFNDPKDFEKYPITIDTDINKLEHAGCDVLFLPAVADIYPDGIKNLPPYEIGFLETVLEGKYRTGHFQGVCQVVHRLLNVVKPDCLYLGQKDFQQCMVIKRLIEITGLKIETKICATLREDNGLAMSSRNMRLNDDERKKAACIFEALSFIKREIKPGYIEDLKTRAVNYLNGEGFSIDYVEISNASNLSAVSNWDGETELVALAAAYLNNIRLIDNMLLQ